MSVASTTGAFFSHQYTVSKRLEYDTRDHAIIVTYHLLFKKIQRVILHEKNLYKTIGRTAPNLRSNEENRRRIDGTTTTRAAQRDATRRQDANFRENADGEDDHARGGVFGHDR
jgi:hypothetical protein